MSPGGGSINRVGIQQQQQQPGEKYANFEETSVNGDTMNACPANGASGGKPWQIGLRLCLCVLAGIIFGWTFEKTRVFEPASIRLQMVFERWIMLKLFLAAAASGQLVLCVLSVLPWTKKMFADSLEAFQCSFSDKGILTSALGPFILGVGMTLSGACPGMVLIQVGAWSKNSIYTFIGVLVGALLYGVAAPWIVRITRPKNPFKVHTIHQKLKVPYFALALPMFLVLAATVFLLEWFINWEDDLDCWNRNDLVGNTSNPFAYKSWPPSVGGALVGLIQLIVVMSVKDTIGGSSSYVTLVSQWVVTDKLQKVFPHLAKARCGIANWWPMIYVASAVLGGLLSALSSDSLATSQGVSIASALGGGVLLLLGARLAAGCTSGHGLSGMALLMWLSFIAVPAMFAGAICLGFTMKATGALYDFHCHSGEPCFDIPHEAC